MANVKLKDWNGIDVIYSGIEKISVETDTGETAVFTHGEVGEDITADADFSGGDMVLSHADGKLMRAATVKKPENLLPENIAKGIEIAGVTGEFSGGSVEFEDEMMKCYIYQLDAENKEIILYKILYDELYAITGSYEVVIPNQLEGYSVVISSEGVPN